VICDYLCHKALADRRPAYMRLDPEGIVLAAGGDLTNYRVESLPTGVPISVVFDFMEGLLPLEDDACHLACLQPQAGACIDAHIIPESPGYWLLLLDTSAEERRLQEMQQKAHELALLRETQARRLSGKADGTTDAALLAPPFEPAGERKDIVVIAVGLRWVDATDPAAAPAAYLEQLDLLRRRLAAHFQAQAGVLYRQSGDFLMVLYGLIPSPTAKEEQALNALLPILHDTRCQGSGKHLTCGTNLRPALGMASGPAIVGLDDAPGAARLQVVGTPLQVAVELQRQAAPGQVLLDRATFENADGLQNRFRPLAGNEARDETHLYTYRRVPRT
jgi:class 3 adenylate cyclase